MKIRKAVSILLCSSLAAASFTAAVTADSAGKTDAPLSAVCADSSGDVVSGCEYTIMVRLSGKYLTAAQDGNVCQWESKEDSTQQWRIVSAGDGKCNILSAEDSSLAMTVKSGDSTNGSTHTTSPPSAPETQPWTYTISATRTALTLTNGTTGAARDRNSTSGLLTANTDSSPETLTRTAESTPLTAY